MNLASNSEAKQCAGEVQTRASRGAESFGILDYEILDRKLEGFSRANL